MDTQTARLPLSRQTLPHWRTFPMASSARSARRSTRGSCSSRWSMCF